MVRQTSVGLLAAALDDLADERPSAWPMFRMLAPHLQALLVNSAPRLDAADLETLIRVTGDTAIAYAHMNSSEFGIELITTALAHSQKHAMDASPTIVIVRQQLAHLLSNVGRDIEAEKIFRDVLTAQLFDWPADDPANLVARHNLAASVGRMFGWAEALPAFRDLLEDERRLLGDDHRITLVTRMEYAALHSGPGRWSEAEALLRGIVNDATRVLGGDDSFTLAARHNLAQATWRQERQKEAESAFRDLVEDERRALGEDHLITEATSRHGDGGLLSIFQLSTPALHEQLAPFLFHKGVTMGEEDRDEAVKAFDELITRFADDESPNIRGMVGQAMFNKALILRELKRWDETARAFALMAKRHIDDPSPSMRELAARALFNQALVLGELDGAEDEAAAYDELIDRFADNSSPALRELVAVALFNKAIIMRDEPEQALQAIKQAVVRYQDLAEDDPNAFEDQLASARRLLDQVNNTAALAMFDRAVKLRQEESYEEAVAAYERFDSRYRDESSPAIQELVAKALFNKAVILTELGRPEDVVGA